MRKVVFIFPLWLLTSCTVASSPVLSKQAILLPVVQVKNILKQCSRPTPQGVDATWDVSPAVLGSLERDLPKLSAPTLGTAYIIKGKTEYVSSGQSVSAPDRYYRQYVGITVRRKKYIYINAFRFDHSNLQWRKKPVVVCDGGDNYWGALYNPQTGQFSDLEFNGM